MVSDRPENERWPSAEETADAFAERPARVPASPAEIAAELRSLETRLTEAEELRAVEGEELMTRMGAIEVLIDHLNGRVVQLAQEAGDPAPGAGSQDFDLRVGGLEHAMDAMGPLLSVPATISALEQELIALGSRLDARDALDEQRDALVSREIEARISLAEARLGTSQGEAWEAMQEAVSSAERRSESARGRVEERLAEQAAAATSALADLEHRLSSSVEELTVKLGAAAGASGDLAMRTVERLEVLEQDIVAIESRFNRMAKRSRPGDPIEAVADAADEVARIEPLPPAPSPAQGAAAPASRVNINEATFETLRSLGCSVTQTARILSTRSNRGGFSSVEELSEVPGLPASLRTELSGRLTV
jgi:DNA uptake protein ComE-like DNA-binding protein